MTLLAKKDKCEVKLIIGREMSGASFVDGAVNDSLLYSADHIHVQSGRLPN